MREKTADELTEGDTVVQGDDRYEVVDVDDVHVEKREPSGADSNAKVHVRFREEDDPDDSVDETYSPDDIVEVVD